MEKPTNATVHAWKETDTKSSEIAFTPGQRVPKLSKRDMSNTREEKLPRTKDFKTGDVKEMRIAGCSVQLTFHTSASVPRCWVEATVLCGIDNNRDSQSIRTEEYVSREEAEKAAIKQVSTLLGNNTDRSTSRIKN